MSKLENILQTLKLTFSLAEHENYAKLAVENNWSHLQFLQEILTGEVQALEDRRLKRRIDNAKFDVIKTLDNFDWTWPNEIDEMHLRHLFRLSFIPKKGNVILLGGVGLGKSHLASAMGYQACQQGYSTLFVSAIEIINSLSAPGINFKQLLKRYLKPRLLIVDELGYLPIDKRGADILFQVISERYEKGAMIITTNKAFKDWAEIFSGDATLTSAVLDRLLHHADVVEIKGSSYRMKNKMEKARETKS